MFKKQFPFWLFSISLILALILPVLIQDGMFMDAMLYTSVSKNLGNGIGSFWFPVFSKCGIAGLSTFHEHPPLVFGIQSLFFRLLGNSMYTERIYVLLTLFITGFLIVSIWKQITKGSFVSHSGWIPLFLWIIIPVCFWSFSNNMQENTMGIFVLLSVYFYLKINESRSFNTIYLLCSALSIFLATFSKGIPGFFPIAIPFIYWLCTKKISSKQIFSHSFILCSIPLLIYLLLFNLPESGESLSNYLFKRVLIRINDAPTVDSYFWIIGRLLAELILPLGIVMLLFSIFRKKGYTPDKKIISLSCFFLLFGLAGAAPLMLTKVQKGFYFVPSLPFFAIGFSLLISQPVSEWSFKIMEGSKNKILLLSSIVLLCLVIIFSSFNIGKVSRDKNLLHDAYLIGNTVPENSTINIPSEMWNEWSMQCYLIRYFNISLDPTPIRKNDFVLTYKNLPDTSLSVYEKVPLATETFDLYKKRKE